MILNALEHWRNTFLTPFKNISNMFFEIVGVLTEKKKWPKILQKKNDLNREGKKRSKMFDFFKIHPNDVKNVFLPCSNVF